MRKNSLFYMLGLFIIMMFSFRLDVYAAQELTCVYEKGDKDDVDKVAITQDKDGKIVMYKNVENVDIDNVMINGKESYWKESKDKYEFDSSVKLDSDGKLMECPIRKVTATEWWDVFLNGEGFVTFYGDKSNKGEVVVLQSQKVEHIITHDTASASDELIYDKESNRGKGCGEIVDDSMKWLASHDGDDLFCLYQKTIDDDIDVGKHCHIIQINMGANGVKVYDSLTTYFHTGPYGYTLDSDLIIKSSSEQIAKGECPQTLQVKRVITDTPTMGKNRTTTIGFSGLKNAVAYDILDVAGKNTITGAEASKDFTFDITFGDIENITCEDLFGSSKELQNFVKTGINVVKICVPIILLVLGSLDFAQAVFASNEDNIKKAQSKFIKRLIIAVLIFLIPTILKTILGIAHSIWPVVDADLCGLI